MIDIARRTTVPTNQCIATHIEIVVCTTGPRHLLDRLPIPLGQFVHCPSTAEPRLLGFECHAALRDRISDYDYYCYLEDDLLVRDPWFFVKLRWFTSQFGDGALLMPNRMELAHDRVVHKAYVDGPIKPEASAQFQNTRDRPLLESKVMDQPVAFERTSNPHSGCFFLNARQMKHWSAAPYFLDRDTRFVGPLESAATLGVMRTFRIYKPAAPTGSFLEVEHSGTAFLDRIRLPDPGPTS